MKLLALLLLASGCASHTATPATPSYRPITTAPAAPQATLYADCLADAIANHRYAHAADSSTSLLLFTCTGEPARRFFDGLAAWSSRIGSEFTYEGQTFRSTARVRHDLFGVDYCSSDSCVITLNAGDFID